MGCKDSLGPYWANKLGNGPISEGNGPISEGNGPISEGNGPNRDRDDSEGPQDSGAVPGQDANRAFSSGKGPRHQRGRGGVGGPGSRQEGMVSLLQTFSPILGGGGQGQFRSTNIR